MTLCKVIFIKDTLNCAYDDANRIQIDCFSCRKPIVLKLNQKNWKCQHCQLDFNPYGIVYKATRKTDTKTYIGQTITPLRERIRGHMSQRKERTYFGNALKYAGVDAFDWEIVDWVAYDKGKDEKVLEIELNHKEIKWIEGFNTFIGWDGSNGFNLTTGGGNFSMAATSVAKRSAEKHGKAKLTTEKVKIIKLLLRETGMYLKEVGAVFDMSYGTVHDIKSGRIWDSVTLEDTDTLDGSYKEFIDLYPKERNTFMVFNVITKEFKGEFDNQRECAKQFGVDYRNLNTILKGWKKEKSWKKTADNYTFIYNSDYSMEWENKILPNLKSNIGKEFYAYNYSTGMFVGKYTNQNECARDLGVNNIAINECLWKNQSFHKDYIFIFKEDFSDEWLEELIEIAKRNKKKSNK